MKIYNIIYIVLGFGLLMSCMDGKSADAVSPTNTTTGQGGSMARFTIAGNYLYTVDSRNLRTYDITNPAEFNPGQVTEIGADIETIFPFGDKLYIGSRSGMYIFGLNNPALPSFISVYEHITSCDPVVTDGNWAYVTLRTGSTCRSFGSQSLLELIDVRNPAAPTMVGSTVMESPYGLGLGSNNLLFVCEGDKGLKVFDRSQVPAQIVFVKSVGGFHAYDIIPYNADKLIITGADGIYQYSYTSDANLSKLSHIPKK